MDTANPHQPAAAGSPRFLLVHGTATTARIWDGVRAELPGEHVVTPDRPATGQLAGEIAALAPLAGPDVVFGGVSGGATLGLALLAAGVPLAAAVLHEPAVGSLLPGLLAPVAAAWSEGGLAAFGRTLYGPAWDVSAAPADPGAVERDLAMFLAFEPAPPTGPDLPIIVTVGEYSPPARHEAASVLEARFGLRVVVLPGCGHAAHLEQPAGFAGVLRSAVKTHGPMVTESNNKIDLKEVH